MVGGFGRPGRLSQKPKHESDRDGIKSRNRDSDFERSKKTNIAKNTVVRYDETIIDQTSRHYAIKFISFIIPETVPSFDSMPLVIVSYSSRSQDGDMCERQAEPPCVCATLLKQVRQAWTAMKKKLIRVINSQHFPRSTSLKSCIEGETQRRKIFHRGGTWQVSSQFLLIVIYIWLIKHIMTENLIDRKLLIKRWRNKNHKFFKIT